VVTFDQTVAASGSPALLLETGVTDRLATLFAGSGTNQLTFRYTVQAGDVSSDLDYASADALSLGGGTITRLQGGGAAVLTLPFTNGKGLLTANDALVVDGSVRVTGVSSPTQNGTYRVGDIIDVVVSFDEAVVVTGTPVVLLDTGNVDRLATFFA